MSATLALTPATARDNEYLYRLTEQTMRAYAEATWGAWNEQMACEFADKTARDGSFQLISQDGIRAGAVRVLRFPGYIQLDQLYVEPRYQRRGIGSEIVRGLIAEARAAKKPLRLRVLKVNPAKAPTSGSALWSPKPRTSTTTWSMAVCAKKERKSEARHLSPDTVLDPRGEPIGRWLLSASFRRTS